MSGGVRSNGSTLAIAAALSLGPAVSLGLGRFSYALLLPPMRDDLGWSYLTAGAMNTVNAAGYFAGALAIGALLARRTARWLFLVGIVATALALALHGVVSETWALYSLRFLTGVGSALTFICGGLLAARLVAPAGVASPPQAAGGVRAGLVLGLYYGGTGLGIVASALLVPWLADVAGGHAWQSAWIGLGVLSLLAAAVSAPALRDLGEASVARSTGARFPRRRYLAGLVAYFGFGLGYIGYMTFIVSLLKEQGLSSVAVTAFYVALGVAVIASSWLWAGLLQRARGGGALALLNALLAVATLLPVVVTTTWAAFVSGVLFGAVFLSLVASTTALVRHNAAPAQWAGGIAAFTAVFAFGQIVGPSLVGALSDAAGGLKTGFVVSAVVLAASAIVAMAQRPVPVEAAPERQ